MVSRALINTRMEKKPGTGYVFLLTPGVLYGILWGVARFARVVVPG